jgi:hypothetical protein
MLTYEKVKGKESQFQSLVNMGREEFEWLHNYYEVEWNNYIAHFTVSGEPRIRPHRVRKDGKLEDNRDQLLFVLHYLKSNALQEHHAAAYAMSQPQANGWIHLLIKLLRRTLKKLGHLPERRASRIKELLEKVEQVFVDGTERDIQRPSHPQEQKEHYSGKKKPIK